MRKTIYFMALAVACTLLFSCGNSNSEIIKLVAERDSLRALSESQTAVLDDYGKTIKVIKTTLDSIAEQENLLFIGTGELPVTKDDVKSNLMRFEAVLKRQHERITRLEEELALNADSLSMAMALLQHFEIQLANKDREIVSLKKELEKRNLDIRELQRHVEEQRGIIDAQNLTIGDLQRRNKRQGEALARQDAILNNGYVLIGSKNDLKRKGIVKGGKLVSDAALDRTKFAKVDIRKWEEVTFSAKRPLILTNMPASSYELTTNGKGEFTLHVLNPSDFWRISNYLVIQTD